MQCTKHIWYYSRTHDSKLKWNHICVSVCESGRSIFNSFEFAERLLQTLLAFVRADFHFNPQLLPRRLSEITPSPYGLRTKRNLNNNSLMWENGIINKKIKCHFSILLSFFSLFFDSCFLLFLCGGFEVWDSYFDSMKMQKMRKNKHFRSGCGAGGVLYIRCYLLHSHSKLFDRMRGKKSSKMRMPHGSIKRRKSRYSIIICHLNHFYVPQWLHGPISTLSSRSSFSPRLSCITVRLLVFFYWRTTVRAAKRTSGSTKKYGKTGENFFDSFPFKLANENKATSDVQLKVNHL